MEVTCVSLTVEKGGRVGFAGGGAPSSGVRACARVRARVFELVIKPMSRARTDGTGGVLFLPEMRVVSSRTHSMHIPNL